MGIWESLRRLSSTKARQGLGRRRDGQHKATRNRDLRVEKFEDRVLLSINPTGIDEDLLWSRSLALAIEQKADLGQYSEENLEATTSWVVGLADGDAPDAAAASFGADYQGSVSGLPNGYVWEFST